MALRYALKRACAARPIALWWLIVVASGAGCREQFDLVSDDSGAYAPCCHGLGHCVAEALLPSEAARRLGGETCAAPLLCVPDVLVDEAGSGLQTCRSLLDAEGRCVPECLPAVAGQLDQLPSDGCEEHHVCAPCFDPLDGKATGLCQLGGDAPEEDPVRFTDCCDGLARCVPQPIVAEEARQSVDQNSCDDEQLCVPELLLRADGSAFERCTSVLDGEGRCVPACLPAVAGQTEQLPSEGCAMDHVCAPCFDPVDASPTGVCELGSDVPPDGPRPRFPYCCRGDGRCIPSSSVTEDLRRSLDAADCPEGEDLLCSPVGFVEDPQFMPQTCRSLLGAEGRCLPSCLPAVSRGADRLTDGGCPENHLCAPCFSLLDGEPTGVCDLGEDPGPEDPALTFASCCEDTGRCVPVEVIAQDEQPSFPADDCDDAQLCIPDLLVEEGSTGLSSCTSLLEGEGRCVPTCMPAVRELQRELPSEGCPRSHVCAPCFDPLDGQQTGVCELADDPGPSEDPVTFDACCSGAGRCLPEAMLSQDEGESLGRDSCSSQQLCVPARLLDAADPVLETCSSLLGAEGRCVPSCLPAVAEQAEQLPAEGCGANQLCAPCFDPLDGSATGLCALGDDEGPSDEPLTFATCCGGEGRCLPRTIVPESDQAQLGAADCPSDGEPLLCSPLGFIEDPLFVPQTCQALLGAEGRCTAQCLPAIVPLADQLQRDLCAEGQLCAPCFDPLDGSATGACELGGDPGPAYPPIVFGDCCNNVGRCVPSQLVPEQDRAALPRADCHGADLCAPEAFLRDPQHVPTSCSSLLGGEGRCLPECLLEDAAALPLPTDGCAAHHLCAPCYDPLDSLDTGACRFGGDPGPSQDPIVFESCCELASESRGACLPLAIAPEQAQSLPRETCSDPDSVCAPRELLRDPTLEPTPCTALGGAISGACVYECLVPAELLPLTTSGTCDEIERCVPCSIDDEPTGACG